MRKTIEIDDDLKALIDKLRTERGDSMKKIVNDALRRGLDDIEQDTSVHGAPLERT
jgi:Arc/MetJ family transcription regulator